MGGRPPATGWMQSSVSASQPPNPTSPGRKPTSRTPASQPANPRSPGRKPTSRTPDHQEKEKRHPKSHRHQSTQDKEKQMVYIRRKKSKEVASSVRDEPEAPLLTDFQDGIRARTSNQMQHSPGKAKEKRQLDRMTTMEDVANTSQRGEVRERKLQKLISSEKNDIEAGAMPRNPPITHNPDDSSSLQSSTLNWVSTFDDVSSTDDVGYRVTGEMVKVGNYIVHQKHSATMEAIIKKYGDIAKDCRKTSTMLRSCAVRGVCEVVEGLQIPLDQLSHKNLKAYSCFVKEVLVMGLSVKWLEERLDEVSDTIDSIYEYKHLRDTRKANTEKMKDLEKEVGLKETQNGKCESEVVNLQCVFEAATLEVKKKKSAINDVKSRCRAIPRRLLGGIF